MAIRFRCERCTGLMSISSRKAGAMVQCPTCGKQTLVPSEDIFLAAPPPVQESPPLVKPPTEAIASAVVLPKSPEVEPEIPVAPVADGEKHEVEHSHEGGAPLISTSDSRARFHDAVMHGQHHEEGDSQDEEDEDDSDAPAMTLRRRSGVDDEMDLTPMVDVTFQLLIFFMVTASFALQKSIEVPTPDPDKKGAAQTLQILDDLEGSSIRVNIDAANAIQIDDEAVGDPSRVADVLKDKMRREQKTEVLISANAAALHRTVIAVIDASNSVGMQKIRLVSRQGQSD